MRYLAFAMIGAIVGILAMLIYTFTLEYNEAEQVTIECEPTDMYAISGARKMRVYDCGEQ